MIAFLIVLFYTGWTPQFVDFEAEKNYYFWLISCCKGLETDIKKMDHRIVKYKILDLCANLQVIWMKG